jgi:glycerol-3-phosphate O-acyltransferase / dihydroxyacetone phosphate acyltransferase
MSHRNAPISFFMRFIYLLLRIISRAGIAVFYRSRLVLGRENLKFDGPAIVVSNHPSTLMDPLNAGINIRQEMFFLANYGLFKNPVSNWILTRLFCIPVKRKEDVNEGEARDNDAAFEQSFQHLEKNGVLFIAAEGVSWMNRYVRPFKTGTARIALGAERRNHWQLGVQIIPVGISYDAPRLFRSRTTVEYGAPIDPKPWAEAYQKDPEKTVEDFTTLIQSKVAELTLNSGSEAGDVFVDQTEIMLRNSPLGLSKTDRYLLLKAFLVKHIDDAPLKARVADYFSALGKAGLTDAGLSKSQNRPSTVNRAPSTVNRAPSTVNRQPSTVHRQPSTVHRQPSTVHRAPSTVHRAPSTVYRAPSLLLLSPFFLLGYGFWFLPCWLPWLLCKRLDLYPGYDSNVKMLAGLFTFPLALWGGWKLAFGLFGSSLWAWVTLGVLIGCGYLAEIFLDIAKAWQEARAARAFQKKNPVAWKTLSEMRDEILRIMLIGK